MVAQGVHKLQFLGRSVRLVVVYERSVYALCDFVNAAYVFLYFSANLVEYRAGFDVLCRADHTIQS